MMVEIKVTVEQLCQDLALLQQHLSHCSDMNVVGARLAGKLLQAWPIWLG